MLNLYHVIVFHHAGFIEICFCTVFQYRLVEDEERRWTDENIDNVALKHFPNIDREKALNRPILYSNWLSKVGVKNVFCEVSEIMILFAG